MSDAQRVRQIEQQRKEAEALARYIVIVDNMISQKVSSMRLDNHVSAELEAVFNKNGFSVRSGSDKGGNGRCECNYAETCGNHDRPYTIINAIENVVSAEDRWGK
jgi:hypothetical protein